MLSTGPKEDKMNNYQMNARIAGIFFLTAMAGSIIGGGILSTIITDPDYINNISSSTNQVWLGVILELVNVVSVLGIAAMFYPAFKKHNEGIAIAYFGNRVIEAIICTAATIPPLLMITLSSEYSIVEFNNVNEMGSIIIALRNYLVDFYVLFFFTISAALHYYLFLKSRLIPRWISIWGIISLVGIILANVFNLFSFGIGIGMVLALPIILNEIFLGVWLIVKGFNTSQIPNK